MIKTSRYLLFQIYIIFNSNIPQIHCKIFQTQLSAKKTFKLKYFILSKYKYILEYKTEYFYLRMQEIINIY